MLFVVKMDHMTVFIVKSGCFNDNTAEIYQPSLQFPSAWGSFLVFSKSLF